MREPADIHAKVYQAFAVERTRAHLKHKDKPGGSMEMRSAFDPEWLAVLVEEVGEASTEINDYRHGLFTKKEYVERLRAELVQVGAMTAAWVAALDDVVIHDDGCKCKYHEHNAISECPCDPCMYMRRHWEM